MMIKILIPVAAMAVLGVAFGLGLAYALKIFGIKIDESVFRILEKLPGSNCGACGKPGCAAFAEALKNGEAVPSGCVVSNDEARKAISEILGIEHKSARREVATVLCNGGTRALDKYGYRGIKSCRAAALVFGGPKVCSYGCIGLGECVDACPFDAISMGPDKLPVVDQEKCTACGKCIKVCPKNLFHLLPVDVKYYVKCSSRDKGGITAKACRAGCIACLKCERACPEKAVKVASNLSKIDPAKCRNIGKCFEVCPTKVIVKR
ncbi:MAG TPA: RnfABCDGE type electron transport complex subunit B [Candidatus Omnitrophota bacterium]|nr:RnfABCDGE type electron transport complex subunit B [Candidatus Omnitrophota bacterium]